MFELVILCDKSTGALVAQDQTASTFFMRWALIKGSLRSLLTSWSIDIEFLDEKGRQFSRKMKMVLQR